MEASYINIEQIKNNIEAAIRHNAKDLEFPDVIGFADYRRYSRAFAEDLACEATSEGYIPEPLTLFQYPNYHPQFPGKSRTMAIASIRDSALLRLDAGPIGELTDPAISDRVCSYRLTPLQGSDDAWTFRKRQEGWRLFTEGGIAILDKGALPFMCRTDVTKYYPSVELDLLRELLLRQGCYEKAVRRIDGCFKFWQRFCGLKGLPIGPEASAVLGNFFLSRVDQSIVAGKADHLRYGDDILIFTEGRSIGEAILGLIDCELRSLGLSISVEKTMYFDDPAEAKANLQDPALASLGSVLTHYPRISSRALRRAFDRWLMECDEIKPNRYNWILETLSNRNESYRRNDLVRRRDLMNVDPKKACRYMISGKIDKQAIEESVRFLSEPAKEHFDALTYHLLLALASAKVRMGIEERREFEHIATNKSRPWPIRAAAWRAFAKSDGTKTSTLLEAVEAESEPNVRRAIITTLKGRAGRRCANLLKEIAQKYPKTRYTVEWVKAA